MKFFAFVVLFAAVAYAADDKMRSSYGGSAPAPSYGSAPAAAPSYGSSSSSYGGAQQSIPAPPCSSNYLFSCQPSMQPAPCAQSAPSYGSSGAYSTNYATYALPQWGVNGFQA